MALTDVEARVLSCLIEKEASTPDSYPLTLNALRLACNQSTNRNPVMALDDRTVDQALLSLKSQGLVRYVHPAHGGRTTRYRHSADERWKLSPGEAVTLAMLSLRGPQTANEIRTRVERLLPAGERTATTEIVHEHLDTLAARSPEPLAERQARRPGDREERWVSRLSVGAADVEPDPSAPLPRPGDDELRWADDPTQPAPRTIESPEPLRHDDADVTAAIARHPLVVRLGEENRQLRATLADLDARIVRLERRVHGDPTGSGDPTRPFDGALDDDL